MEKKFSSRRRKTFGKDDPSARSLAECRGDASDGTRSSISGFRLITHLRWLPASKTSRRQANAPKRADPAELAGPVARFKAPQLRTRPRSMLTDLRSWKQRYPLSRTRRICGEFVNICRTAPDLCRLPTHMRSMAGPQDGKFPCFSVTVRDTIIFLQLRVGLSVGVSGPLHPSAIADQVGINLDSVKDFLAFGMDNTKRDALKSVSREAAVAVDVLTRPPDTYA